MVEDKDLNIEKEEDLPQVVQLESGDLDATEYIKLKNREEVESNLLILYYYFPESL